MNWKLFAVKKGKVRLPPFKIPPKVIQDLYQCNSFIEKLVSYNNALALTSLGCSEIKQLGFNPIFKIKGKLYHTIGSLLPPQGPVPKFAQIYIYDRENEIQHRIQNHESYFDKETIKKLQDTLHQYNPYVKSFKSAAELITIQNDVNIVLHHKKSLKPSEAHNRSYNLPQSSEVAALLSGETAGDRDIILSARDGTLKRISYYHRSYDPLQYVLLFPYGEDGWEIDMKRVDKCNTLTLKDFYSYRLQIRKDDHNTHMRGGRLTQIYAVDAWCKVESSRFHWVRTHQKEIRTDKYSGLLDAIAENDLQNAGLRIVLPPSIYCSPRFYLECYLDAMALVLYFGKPDYFFTLTTNPNWIEIRNSLLPGQKVKDRPDIAVRVFKIKLESLLDDFMNKNVIGKVKVLIYTIEWQKRGLTHAHILITMQDSDKPRTPEMIE